MSPLSDLRPDSLHWEEQTANFTASTNVGYKIGSSITITLPNSPNDNEKVFFASLADLRINPSVVDGNGNTIMGDNTIEIDRNFGFTLLFNSNDSDWKLVSV